MNRDLRDDPDAFEPADTVKDGLREELAALSHKQWSGWMRYLFSKCKVGKLRTVIPEWGVERWRRQMETEYADLTEAEKGSDREEADRVLAIVARRAAPPADTQPDVEKIAEEVVIGLESQRAMRLHGRDKELIVAILTRHLTAPGYGGQGE